MTWRSVRVLAPLGLFLVVFAVDVACPSGMTADSIRAIPVGVSIVHWHTITLDHFQPLLDPGFAVSVAHGHQYPYFPWAVSLFALPWIVGFDILHKLGIGQGSVALVRSRHDWELQVVSMAAVIAAAAVFVYFTALRAFARIELPRRRTWALGFGAAFVFTTPVWSTAGRSMWQQGPSILCLAAAIFFALRAVAGERGWTAMGAAAATSYTMRPTDAIPLGMLFLWVLICHRRALLRASLGAVGPLAVLVSVNLVSYGQPLSPYYTAGQGFAVSATMANALAGNLVSPARGLFWYFPLVVLSGAGVGILWRRHEFDGFWRTMAVIPVLQWIVISSFKHWWGGDSYGPRLMSDMIPVFAALSLPAVEQVALSARRRVATRHRLWRRLAPRGLLSVVIVAGSIWGFAVNAEGATLRSAWCWNSEPTSVDAHPSKLWQWSDPQFLRGYRRLVFGPNRSSEFIRDGVDLYGCPSEPVRP